MHGSSSRGHAATVAQHTPRRARKAAVLPGLLLALLLPAAALANQPPQAWPDSVTTNEDTAVDVVVTANDTDPDGDTIQLALNAVIEDPTLGTTTRLNSTTIRYTPYADVSGTDQFRYRIHDGNGNVDSALVTVTISEVNDKPVAVDDSASTTEEQSVTVNVTANDTDVDGDWVRLISNPIVTAPSYGTATKVDGAQITYSPDPNFSGTDSFQYEVGDGRGARARAWVTVSVAGTNDPPTAWPDSATTNEDTSVTITVTANDTDPDGDTIQLALNAVIEDPTLGTTTRLNSTTIRYTPYADVSGTDQFRYRIHDGNGEVDSALVTVTINAVNDPPVAVNDSASTTEEQSVTVNVTANDTDVDGDTVVLISSPIVTAPSDGTAYKVDGARITYTPNAGFTGTDSFQYEVGDGRGLRDRAWVTVTVSEVNNPPVAQPDSATTDEDVAVDVVVTANDSDPDGDTVQLTLSPILEAPTQGTATRLSSTTIRYTPNPDAHGTDQLRYRIHDGNGEVDSALVSLTINAVNDPPVAADDAVSTDEETAVTVNVTANDADVDGDTVVLISAPVVTAPTHGTATKVDGAHLTYTPHADFAGTDSFEYEVGDGNGGRDRAWVTVTVNPVNDAPVAQPDSATTNEDTAVTITVTANDSDPDGDTVVLALSPILEAPTQGTAERLNDTQIRYTPDPDTYGTDQFRYRIHDGNGGVDSALVSLTIDEVNDPPVANDDAATTPGGTAVAIAVTANDTDVDGDTVLLISDPVVTPPTRGAAVKLDGATIEYTPDAGFLGTDSFVYEIGDGRGLRDRATVTVTVENRPPEAQPDSASVDEDSSVTVDVTANDSDPDGQAVVLALNAVIEDPANGTATRASASSITYTPDPDFAGSDQLRYRIHDGEGGVDSALLSITVDPVNDPPVAVDDSASTHAGTPVTVNVTANDTDVDGDTVLLISDPVVTPPAGGTAVKVDGSSIAYTPNPGFSGSDSFEYEIGDGNAARSRAWVTVTVSNEPPVAADDSAVTEMSTEVVIDVTANDSDPDGDVVRLTADPVVSPPTDGAVVRRSDSQLAYTPNTAFDASDSFVYEVTDGNGGLAQATVTVTVSQEPSDVEVRLAWNGTEVKAGSTVHLPDVDPGEADSLLFEIHNVGAGPLEVRNWDGLVSGTCFSQIENPDPVVRLDPPLTTFRVRAQCAEVGNHSGQVTIETNDPDEPAYSFELRAAVGLPTPPIRIVDPNGQEVPHEGTFRLPDTGVGQTLSRRLRIVNDGLADLGLADPTGLVSGVGFSQIEDPADPVPGDGETGFRVRLFHNQVGTYHGEVVIETTDPSFKPYRFRLVGEVGEPDFTLTAEPTYRARVQGFGAPYLVSVTPAFRFSSPVTLSVSGLPGDAWAEWRPGNEVTPGESATLWVHTEATTPPGTYSLSVLGVGGGLSHTADVTLRVDPAVPADFAVNVDPSAVTVTRGSSAQLTVDLAVEGGFAGTAALSASGLPAGASASFEPAALGAGQSSALTLSTAIDTPPGDYEVTVTATIGGETRDAVVQLVIREQPAPGEPVIDSMTPELVEGGAFHTFLLLGVNLKGAVVTVATEQPEGDGGVSRAFPTIVSTKARKGGTELEVQVNCTDPDVIDFYNLVVDNGVGQASSRAFRVLPPGPVVDLVAPGQPERGGGTYVMAVGGHHLSGATVHAEPAGSLEILGVEATDDEHINGLLRAPASAPLGPVDLVVTDPQGREARITIEIVDSGLAVAPSRIVRTQALDPVTLEPMDGPSPTLRYQRPAVRRLDTTEVTAGGLRAQTAASMTAKTADAFSFGIYLSYTLDLFEFTWSQAFVYDLETGKIGDQILKNLGLGERVRFGAFVLSFYLRAAVRVEIRITNTGFTWPRFCFIVDTALQIPGVDGFFQHFDYCIGGGTVPFVSGSTDSLSVQGGQCASVTEDAVQPIEGLKFAEAEQLDCCDQPIGVTGQGTAFTGSWFPASFSVSNATAGTTTPGQPCTCSVSVSPACVVEGKTQDYTAIGRPTGGTYQWKITQGSGRASIQSGGSSDTVTVKGDAVSSAANDVELEVTYHGGGSTCTSSVNLSVVKVSFPFHFKDFDDADTQNSAREVNQSIEDSGLPQLGWVEPGQPSGTEGFHKNVQLMATITPCDTGLTCGFDFKRDRTGTSALIRPKQSPQYFGTDCPGRCDDEGPLGNADEDLKVAPNPYCSIYVVDTPGFHLSSTTGSCSQSSQGTTLAQCFNFWEWVEVDGVMATPEFRWHASTRVRCDGSFFVYDPTATGNSLGGSHLPDCSHSAVIPLP